MKRRLLIFAAILVALALALAVALTQPRSAAAQDDAAVAINTRDGASIFRFAFHIRRVMGDVVDQTNAAVAYSSCTECETIALAVQAILVFGDPDVVSPENVALALNYECTACETLAMAYQYVFSTGGVVHFTAEGNRRIAELRRELRELLQAGLPLAELAAQVDALLSEFHQVLTTELVSAGKPGSAGTQPAETETGDATTETTGTTGTETTETTETETTERTETERTETGPGARGTGTTDSTSSTGTTGTTSP